MTLSTCQPLPPRTHRAFTLAESVTAMVVTGIIMAALASVVSLVARSVPIEGDAPARARDAFRGLQMLADDAAEAQVFKTMSATECAFSVPDRTGDALDDTVRYWWTADLGSAVMRSLNGAGEVPIIGAADDFSLVYSTRSYAEPDLPVSALDASQTLAWWYYGSESFQLSQSRWIAQTFTPRLPANATAWKPLKVRVKYSLLGGIADTVELGLSVGSTLSQSMVFSSPSGVAGGLGLLWTEYDVSLTPEVPAGTPVTFVMKTTSVLASATVEYRSSGAADGMEYAAFTSNSGKNWILLPEGALNMEIVGQIRRPTSGTVAVSRLRSITVSVTPTGSTPVTQGVSVLGKPN